MGLGFKDVDAGWSYSGFNAFRRRVAAEIGVKLDDMYGFGGTTRWSTVKDDVKWFLDHSDCEGSIGPNRCLKIAPRLIEIVSKWPKHDYDRQNALSLAEGMESLGKKGKSLIFC